MFGKCLLKNADTVIKIVLILQQNNKYNVM